MMQPEVKLKSNFNNKSLHLSEAYAVNGDTIICSTLKVYLGAFSLLKSGREVAQWPQDYFLVDFADAATTTIRLQEVPAVDFDAVSFLVGVDSSLQVDGPHGGALDPANGMYWTWQNGYIYLKMEGTASQSIAPKREFAWHLGGYGGALNAAQRLVFPCSKKQCTISFDWSTIMGSFNMLEQHHVMSPSVAALHALESLKSGITLQ